jgi:hypothetical protein
MGNLFLEYTENPIICKCGVHLSSIENTSSSQIESNEGILIATNEILNVYFENQTLNSTLIKSRSVYLFDPEAVHRGSISRKMKCKNCGQELGYSFYRQKVMKYLLIVNRISII